MFISAKTLLRYARLGSVRCGFSFSVWVWIAVLSSVWIHEGIHHEPEHRFSSTRTWFISARLGSDRFGSVCVYRFCMGLDFRLNTMLIPKGIHIESMVGQHVVPNMSKPVCVFTGSANP